MSREGEFAVIMGAVGLATLGIFLAAWWQGAREIRGRLEAARPFADALAVELALPEKAPCTEPFRNGTWAIAGEVKGRRIQLIVSATSVLLSIALEPTGKGARWDLVRRQEFGHGGLYDDPADPYRPLPDDAIGPGWMARGHGAEARACALPDSLKDFLSTPPGEAANVFDGQLRIGAPASSAADVAQWVRRVTGVVTGATTGADTG